MSLHAERGFLIYAVNTDDVDYVACAVQLAHSIKSWHPGASVSLLTEQMHDHDPIFDFVVPLPFGDKSIDPAWKLDNDWQAGWATPYRETIKLEADMLLCSPIDHWWDIMRHRDVFLSTGCLNFYGNPSDCRFYRKIFDQNNLPDVYSAITYWRTSLTAKEFWRWVRVIFENWDDFKTLLKFPDERPTTDVVYAMASQIVGTDLTTMPFASFPRIVHMKKHIVPIQSSDWTKELVWEIIGKQLRINTVTQRGLLHYHIKTWLANE